jgi:hypothetical protein
VYQNRFRISNAGESGILDMYILRHIISTFMKIALVAPGRAEIPSPNMVSIEVIIWNYACELRRLGHEVDIFNTPWIHEAIQAINEGDYDFVQLHVETAAISFNKYLKKPFVVTSHCSWWQEMDAGDFSAYPAYNAIFPDLLQAPGAFVISEHIAEVYAKSGYRGFLRVLRNPVEAGMFSFAEKGNGKAICLGAITARKRQAAVAAFLEGVVEVDYVGPYEPDGDSGFSPVGTNCYLGMWTRDEVYRKLTDYSCLILLSASEADPLVVKEALAAGLSLVVAQSGAANLSAESFITVLPNDISDPGAVRFAVLEAIKANDMLRPQIREYARERFDYSVMAGLYLAAARDFQAYARGHAA